jgi:hypothetical protein
VYNFDVEDLHCYAVGRNCVLVHNQNGNEGTPASSFGPNRSRTRVGSGQDQAKFREGYDRIFGKEKAPKPVPPVPPAPRRGWDVSKPIGKQLEGKGQLAGLRRNPNLKGVDLDALLKKTPAQLEQMVKAGELSAKALKQLKKAFEGRDLRHGN